MFIVNCFKSILGLIASGIEAHAVDRSGGIFVRHIEQISEEDRTLFQAVARIIITDSAGTLEEQRLITERPLKVVFHSLFLIMAQIYLS